MPPFNFGHVCALLLLVIIVLAAVGTAGPQFSDKALRATPPVVECNNQVFLYQSRIKCDGESGVRRKFDRDEFACKKSYEKLTAAYAFGILACCIGFIALVLSLLTAFIPRIPSWIAVALIVLTFICLTIAWPLSESVRSQRQCDDPNSYKDAGYKIDWGLGLLIAAWCLSAITALLSIIFGLLRKCTRPVVVVKNDHETRRTSDPHAEQHPNNTTTTRV